MTDSEIGVFLSATSLEYLSEEDLIKSINSPNQTGTNGGLCMAYFKGNYPIELYDYEEKLDS